MSTPNKPKKVEEKADEILDFLESHLVRYTKDVFKNTAGYEMKDEEAETVLAKLGKRWLLKVISR